MGYRAYIATTYQVAFERDGYPIEEFEALVRLLKNKSLKLEEPAAIWATSEAGEYWEFYRASLQAIRRKMGEADAYPKDDAELIAFIDNLLETGDPKSDTVRVEAW